MRDGPGAHDARGLNQARPGRKLGLLQLEEEHVAPPVDCSRKTNVSVPTDPTPDDLPREVDRPVGAEQDVRLGAERVGVLLEEGVDAARTTCSSMAKRVMSGGASRRRQVPSSAGSASVSSEPTLVRCAAFALTRRLLALQDDDAVRAGASLDCEIAAKILASPSGGTRPPMIGSPGRRPATPLR